MCLNCQFDLMESGQSPDGLGRDSHHRRRPVAHCARRARARSGHSGARHPGPRSFPAPLMSQRLFGQTPSWNLRLRVFCSLYLARSHAQQLGKFGVSLIPMVSYFQPPRRLRKLRFKRSVLEAHPHLSLTARHLLTARTLEATLVKTLFEVATVSQAPFESPD